MKRFKFLLLAALLVASSVFAAGTGGFPSRPKFQEVYAKGNSGSVWLGNSAVWDNWMGAGAHHDGTNWIADALFAGVFGYSNAAFTVYGNSGLVIGNSYTPTVRFSIDALGVATFTGTVTTTKACAAGYTRTGPNYCAKNTPINVVTLTAAGCTQSAALAGVSDAKAIAIMVQPSITSNNGVSPRQLSAGASGTNNTCANTFSAWTWAAYEHVAVAAGTTISTQASFGITPSSTTGRAYFNATVTLSGPNPAIVVNVIGYYD